jgi:hypothetical protein
MAITPATLLERFRREMDDIYDEDDEAPLWSNEEIYGYMDDAQKEFARRTRYFPTVDTGIAVTNGSPYVSLPLSKYTDIRKVRLESDGRTVLLRNYIEVEGTELEDDYGTHFLGGHWESLTGTPAILITDMAKDQGRLVPIPTADDTLEVVGWRLPLKDITVSSSKFEVTEDHYIRKFTYGMRALAYEKHDSQTYNEAMAAKFKAKWEDWLDETADQIKHATRRTGTVQYGGL